MDPRLPGPVDLLDDTPSQLIDGGVGNAGTFRCIPRADPVAQAQVAAELLAEAAASCTSPEQAAAAVAAAEAARKAAEAAVLTSARATAGQQASPSTSSRPAAAEYLRVAAMSRPMPSTSNGSQRETETNTPFKASAMSKLFGGWEPAVVPAGEGTGSSPWCRNPLGPPGCSLQSGSSTRALDPLAGLDSLLASLRSEFAEEGRM